MRIAILGAAKSIHTIKWAKSLAERGHAVRLFSLPDQKAPDGALEGVSVHYLRTGGVSGYWLCAGELRKKLAAFSPDLLNAHYATGYGTLARRCGFSPTLLSVWGSDVYDFPNGGYFNRRLLLRNLESAAAIASTSSAMAQEVNRLHVTDKRIFLTPFGVDTQVFRRYEHPQRDGIVIGIVKALEPVYGIDYLIQGYSMLKARMQKEGSVPPGGLKLEIYGDGSQLQTLIRLAKTLNVGEETHFRGAVPHVYVPRVLSGFDIFCSPSIRESFGVAAVEAMACELPVVVSDADGLREVVRDRETGFVVTRRDPVTIANKLYLLATDADLRRRMGRAGRSHVQEQYEWADCVAKMEDAMTETAMTARTEQIR